MEVKGSQQEKTKYDDDTALSSEINKLKASHFDVLREIEKEKKSVRLIFRKSKLLKDLEKKEKDINEELTKKRRELVAVFKDLKIQDKWNSLKAQPHSLPVSPIQSASIEEGTKRIRSPPRRSATVSNFHKSSDAVPFKLSEEEATAMSSNLIRMASDVAFWDGFGCSYAPDPALRQRSQSKNNGKLPVENLFSNPHDELPTVVREFALKTELNKNGLQRANKPKGTYVENGVVKKEYMNEVNKDLRNQVLNFGRMRAFAYVPTMGNYLMDYLEFSMVMLVITQPDL
jgi:hypothetical protein